MMLEHSFDREMMSGKEWQKLLQAMPDLAHKYRRQRLWRLFLFSATSLALAAAVIGVAFAFSRSMTGLKPANNAPVNEQNAQGSSSGEPPSGQDALSANSSSNVPDSAQARAQTSPAPGAYEAPNPEMRQEALIKR